MFASGRRTCYLDHWRPSPSQPPSIVVYRIPMTDDGGRLVPATFSAKPLEWIPYVGKRRCVDLMKLLKVIGGVDKREEGEGVVSSVGDDSRNEDPNFNFRTLSLFASDAARFHTQYLIDSQLEARRMREVKPWNFWSVPWSTIRSTFLQTNPIVPFIHGVTYFPHLQTRRYLSVSYSPSNPTKPPHWTALNAVLGITQFQPDPSIPGLEHLRIAGIVGVNWCVTDRHVQYVIRAPLGKYTISESTMLTSLTVSACLYIISDLDTTPSLIEPLHIWVSVVKHGKGGQRLYNVSDFTNLGFRCLEEYCGVVGLDILEARRMFRDPVDGKEVCEDWDVYAISWKESRRLVAEMMRI
ncbi:hypothetical protein BC829DRAFT_406369 [Chytridium lagenaria]|nr:hypothetical protein BC829DRAFT_406369 [Chytridium lagenaria]